jgi:ribosomal protein S18 acetylase RimI-like enzyme
VTPPDPPVAKIQAILETDRLWCAYALADLDPSELPHTVWLLGRHAVVLVYQATDPPVLFAHGDPAGLETCFRQVEPGEYAFALTGTQRALMRQRLRPWQEQRMWRMSLKPEEFSGAAEDDIVPLDPTDEEEIVALFADHPDRPDAFYSRQLEHGTFFGIRQDGRLVSVAGTHVVSESFSVGAIGNVFTRPDLRGRGLGTRVTAVVVARLLAMGLRTIVLNVSMDNHPAQATYRKLGFWPYCGYYEGLAEVAAVDDTLDEVRIDSGP